jgi:transcriptional regulator with XRE-family HTH domain
VTGLHEQLAESERGLSALASARLRYKVLGALHKALTASGLSQSDLARRLHVRRSAVNNVFRGDGNVRVSTFAEYLSAMGYEASIQLVSAGEPRRAALEGRLPRAAFPAVNTAVEITARQYNIPLWLPRAHRPEGQSYAKVLNYVFYDSPNPVTGITVSRRQELSAVDTSTRIDLLQEAGKS